MQSQQAALALAGGDGREDATPAEAIADKLTTSNRSRAFSIVEHFFFLTVFSIGGHKLPLHDLGGRYKH